MKPNYSVSCSLYTTIFKLSLTQTIFYPPWMFKLKGVIYKYINIHHRDREKVNLEGFLRIGFKIVSTIKRTYDY